MEDAEASVRGPLETCPGCRITFAVPAAIAAARAGELDLAEEHEAQMRLPRQRRDAPAGLVRGA